MVNLEFSYKGNVNWGNVGAVMLAQKVTVEEKINLTEDSKQPEGEKA